MKRILVPCDFSRQSNDAYKAAIDIASESKGQIVLLHVLAIPVIYSTGFSGEPIGFDPVYASRVEQELTNELDKMKVLADSTSIPVETEVVVGELITAIKRSIDSKHIDLVVMGTSGASGLAEILIGSNTEKVVRFSPVPVLAVPRMFDIKSVKNILFPSSLDFNQQDFIAKLKELQQFFDATIHVLLINTPLHFRRDAEAKEALEEFVKQYKLANCKLHFRNFVHEDSGIIEFAQAEKMDIIAMATHARKGLAHLFNSSVTESVVNHIQSPIWTYCLKRN